jgi:hypothetical protein
MVLSVLKWLNDTKLYCTGQVKKLEGSCFICYSLSFPKGLFSASSHALAGSLAVISLLCPLPVGLLSLFAFRPV